MADYSRMKLGRKAIRFDHRTLRLARYLTPALPAPPPAIDWTRGTKDWGMMLNDKLGDCTIAACGHAIQTWGINTGHILHSETVNDQTVLRAYEQWDGYNPKNPGSDQGGVELDVLNKWRNSSLGGHRLLAYADPNVANLTEIRQSIALFGGVYIGLSLPLTAQEQDVWDVTTLNGDGAPNSWGGHAVFVPQYDDGGFTCITWGQTKRMTVNFWKAYADEAHVLLGADWLTTKGAPSGFDQTQLLADLGAIV